VTQKSSSGEVVDLSDAASLVGRDFGRSEWVRVDQALIDAFAKVSGDDQWIHVDVDRAQREHGGTVAHGFLTLSLLSALALQSSIRISGVRRRVNYGFDKVRFTSFVPAGARVRLHQTIKSVEPKAGGTAITRHCEIEVEGQEKPALVADWIGVLYP
jgi:acyl dehydratase